MNKAHEQAPLTGITGGGWKFVYTTTPDDYEQVRETLHKFVNATYSIGLRAGKNGRIEDVLWNGPAYTGGLRYPHPERVNGTPDYLSQIIVPVKG
ncbi:MAG: hypothetical protein ACRES9_06685 [Gammaproteobacteria bacterium]